VRVRGRKLVENAVIETSTEATRIYLGELYRSIREQEMQNSEAMGQLLSAKERLEAELASWAGDDAGRHRLETGIRNLEAAIMEIGS